MQFLQEQKIVVPSRGSYYEMKYLFGYEKSGVIRHNLLIIIETS